jgi:hypothetical protein
VAVVSKRTGRPVGRPRKPRPPSLSSEQKLIRKFLNDPDRHSVALLDAMLALEMGTEHACAKSIIVWQVGIERPPRRSKAGRVVTNWERRHTKGGARAATLEGRVATLRAKRGRIRSGEEVLWRTAMASAFMLVLGARDPDAVKTAIIRRAESVGEGDFARRVMLPMLTAKFR